MKIKSAVAYIVSSLLVFMVGFAIYNRLRAKVPAVAKLVEGA